MQFEVHSIGRYTAAQTGRQVLPCAVIALVLAGQSRMRVGTVTVNHSSPYLALYLTRSTGA